MSPLPIFSRKNTVRSGSLSKSCAALLPYGLFSLALAILPPAFAATVAGQVELRDSRDPGVRKHLDFSGVVVALKPVGASIPPRSARTVKILQKDKIFSPHILAVTTGTTVEFPNLDPIYHNAFSSYSGQLFDVGLYPPGTSRSVRFNRKGVVRVFCNIHSSMSAVVVVLDTPWFATSNKSGSFEIDNVPPGEYRLTVFHERATQPALDSLSRSLTVGEQTLNLPRITVSESGYLPIPHKNKYGKDYPPPDEGSLYPGARK